MMQASNMPQTAYCLHEQRLLVGSENGCIYILSATSSTLIGQLHFHRSAVRSLLVIPDNDVMEKAMASPTLAASASDDGKIMLWDLLTTEIVHHSNAGCTAAIHAGTGVASPFSIPVGVSHLVVAQINKSDDAEIAAPLRIFVGRADGSVAMLDLHSAEVLCTQQVTKRSRIQSH